MEPFFLFTNRACAWIQLNLRRPLQSLSPKIQGEARFPLSDPDIPFPTPLAPDGNCSCSWREGGPKSTELPDARASAGVAAECRERMCPLKQVSPGPGPGGETNSVEHCPGGETGGPGTLLGARSRTLNRSLAMELRPLGARRPGESTGNSGSPYRELNGRSGAREDAHPLPQGRTWTIPRRAFTRPAPSRGGESCSIPQGKRARASERSRMPATGPPGSCPAVAAQQRDLRMLRQGRAGARRSLSAHGEQARRAVRRTTSAAPQSNCKQEQPPHCPRRSPLLPAPPCRFP